MTRQRIIFRYCMLHISSDIRTVLQLTFLSVCEDLRESSPAELCGAATHMAIPPDSIAHIATQSVKMAKRGTRREIRRRPPRGGTRRRGPHKAGFASRQRYQIASPPSDATLLLIDISPCQSDLSGSSRSLRNYAQLLRDKVAITSDKVPMRKHRHLVINTKSQLASLQLISKSYSLDWNLLSTTKMLVKIDSY